MGSAQAQQPGSVNGHGAAVDTASGFSWRVTNTGSTEQFRGLAAVNASVAWVSGETGTVLRTVNGGKNWTDVSPPGSTGLAFRDIEAFDAMHAVVLSIGKGKHSRIYTTDDGGQTWALAFMNQNGSAFFDCMAFSPDGIGLAMSDPVNGHFRLVRSTDRGHSWQLFVPKQMPPALDGEFGFAASGTCLVSGPKHEFWIASGGNSPRVFATTDAGNDWSVVNTPIIGGPSAGIYSVDFRSGLQGVAVGGDYTKPDDGTDAAATSSDGGKTWTLSSSPVFGYRSGVSFVPHVLDTVVAVGPTGSDVSRDGGRTWTHFDDDWYDGIECAHDGACWGSGTDGRVAVLVH